MLTDHAQRLFWICAAGAAGTALRYGIGVWAARQFGAGFPVGTILVNLSGCFAIAAIAHVAIVNEWAPTVRGAIVVGFLGGYTTYSSFNHETLALFERSAAAAAANVVITLLGGLGAGALGLAAARMWIGR